VFKSTDSSYANTLLTHAKQLFDFANNYRGKYSDSITDAQSFYA
jgi:endoglucanase